MANSYRYYQHFYLLELLLLLTAGLLLLLIWVPLFGYMVLYGISVAPAFKAGVFVTGTATLAWVLFIIARKEIRDTTFSIEDDSFIKRSPYKLEILSLSGIDSIRPLRIPFLCTLVTFRVGKKSLRFPLLINDAGSLLRELRAALDKSGKAGVLDDTVYRMLLREAYISHQAHRHSHLAFMPLVMIAVVMAAVSLTVSFEIWDLSVPGVITWTFVGLLSPLITYAIAEFFHTRKERKKFSSGQELHFGNPDYLSTGLIVFLVYCLAGLLFKIFSPW